MLDLKVTHGTVTYALLTITTTWGTGESPINIILSCALVKGNWKSLVDITTALKWAQNKIEQGPLKDYHLYLTGT
jgi:hypothetical protein